MELQFNHYENNLNGVFLFFYYEIYMHLEKIFLFINLIKLVDIYKNELRQCIGFIVTF